MIDCNDIDLIEGGAETAEDYYAALQRAINSGVAWSFQGSYGRTMMEAITGGLCVLGTVSARDYWGSYIPSRDEVQAGTYGSLDYVRQHQGDDWADFIATI